MIYRFIIIWFFVLTLSAAEKEENVFKAGEIVVTGSRTKSTVEEASTTTVVTPEDIEKKGASTLDQALEGIPGIQVYTHTKGHKRIRMRGFDQEKIFILVDGVPLNDIYSTDVDLSAIPVNAVSKIVVNRGVSSALYGTDGAIGSINIITKKPEKLFANTKAEYGSWNNSQFAMSHGMPAGDFYYWFSGSVLLSDGFKPSQKLNSKLRKQWYNKLLRYDRYGISFDEILNPSKNQYIEDSGKWNHTEFQKYNASAKVGWNPVKQFETGVNADYHYSESKSNTYQNNCYSDYDPAQKIWKNDRRPGFHDDPRYAQDWILRNRSFVYPENWNFKVAPYFTVDTEKFELVFNSWYYQVYQLQKGYSDNNHLYSKGEASFNGSKSTAIIDPYLDLKTQQGYGFRLLPSIKFSKNYKVNFMFHFRDEFFVAKEAAISETESPGIIEKMGKDYYPVRDLRAQYISAAVEDEFKYKGFRSTVGGSWDAQNFVKFKQRAEMEYGDAYIPSDQSAVWGTRDAFSPVATAMYDPWKNHLRLRSAFSAKTRFPNLNEYSKITTLEMDTGKLKPEKSYNYSGGFEWMFFDKKLSFRNDYFIDTIFDRIAKVNKDEAPLNVEKTVVQGLESSLNLDFEKLGGLLSINILTVYTFLHARNYDDSPEEQVNKGVYLEYMPEHQLVFNLTLDFDWKYKYLPVTTLMFWGEMSFGEVVYVMKSAPAKTDPFSTDYFETASLHDPVMLNLKISQEIWDYFKIWFAVKNLLDDYNSDPFNPGAGRSFFVGASFEYD
ncbi:MAG TPA: TonB-dependent receptor plug domain-containing protein [bacterium]|nr:TonB-dependent receptor plug domain-containing protein [bacterium]